MRSSNEQIPSLRGHDRRMLCTMNLLGLHHVNIKVTDLDAAKKFYGSTLGLTRRTDGPPDPGGGVWYDVGPNQIHVSVGDPPAGNGQHFAMELEDFDAALIQLEQAGYAVRRAVSGNANIADPSGNQIELRPV